ncbi:MAG: carbon storage regulator [Planctomycetaceae bacterium]
MHIVTRHVNEGLVIGRNLEVAVLEIHDDCVRLGLSSPDHDPAYWEETLYLTEVEEPAELLTR